MTNYEIAKNEYCEYLEELVVKGTKTFNDVLKITTGFIKGMRISGFLTEDELKKLRDELFDMIHEEF